jgi:dUTP pyrophosphatase
MNVKKLSDKAVIPSKGSVGAAGYDLYTTESYELKPGERKAFKTDIALAIPDGFYGRVAPRSGLAVKHGIDVLAGVIDSDYRGEILVALINLGEKPVQLPIVKDGKETAIAQIIFERCGTITGGFVEVDDLTATQRGSGGFGSSDNKRETIDQASKQMSKMEELYNKLGGIPTPARKYSELVNEREQQQFNK